LANFGSQELSCPGLLVLDLVKRTHTHATEVMLGVV